MEDKIYQKIKEKEKQTANHYFKMLGINEEIKNTIPKKNLDLEILLKKMELLPHDCDKMDKIDEFHDYLFKFGIELGISTGKKMIIEGIQDGLIDINELIKIDPEEIVDYKMEPTFITDMKETLK